ncbi:hypothetical protein Trydic_g7462 [Trypoxylus dichotomus]
MKLRRWLRNKDPFHPLISNISGRILNRWLDNWRSLEGCEKSLPSIPADREESQTGNNFLGERPSHAHFITAPAALAKLTPDKNDRCLVISNRTRVTPTRVTHRFPDLGKSVVI